MSSNKPPLFYETNAELNPNYSVSITIGNCRVVVRRETVIRPLVDLHVHKYIMYMYAKEGDTQRCIVMKCYTLTVSQVCMYSIL